MHARVSKLEGLPEQVDELGRIATEWLAPSLSEMEGFHTILALADRQSGKVELVTLWESEQAMHQSEQDAEVRGRSFAYFLKSHTSTRQRGGVWRLLLLLLPLFTQVCGRVILRTSPLRRSNIDPVGNNCSPKGLACGTLQEITTIPT
jgi:heme-degrading monooxygenase HmoA